MILRLISASPIGLGMRGVGGGGGGGICTLQARASHHPRHRWTCPQAPSGARPSY